MEEQPPQTPLGRAMQPKCFATPESWEMLADQTMEEGSTGGLGLNNSLNGFVMSFDCYETPPGAVIYREHFDDSFNNASSFTTSVQEERESADADSDSKSPCMVDVGDSLLDSEIAHNNEEGPPNSLRSNQNDASEYRHVLVATPHQSPGSVVNEDGLDPELKEKIDTVSDCVLESYSASHEDMSCENLNDFSNVKEYHVKCYEERYGDKEKECTAESCPLVKSRCEDDDLYSHNSTDFIRDTVSTEMTDKQEEHVCESLVTSSNSGHSNQMQISDVEEAKSVTRMDEAMEPCLGIDKGDAELQSTSHMESPTLPQGDVNSTLKSMGIPQDVIENQLAAFLSMEDPFQCPEKVSDESCQPEPHPQKLPDKDIENESNEKGLAETVLKDCNHSAVQPATSSRRRKKRVEPQMQRRRSVRIARRDSIIASDLQTVMDDRELVELKSMTQVDLPVSDPADKMSVVLAQDTSGVVACHPDSVANPYPVVEQDSVAMPAPCQQVSQSQTAFRGDIPCTVPAESMQRQSWGDSKRENPDELPVGQIDGNLPGSRNMRKKPKRGRRRSVRLERKVQEVSDEPHSHEVTQEVVSAQSACTNTFLADFADFGLGDEWMPGDLFGSSQFAKTPKQKSGRRKSARLSGVSIPLLELDGKSQVHLTVFDESRKTRDQITDTDLADTMDVKACYEKSSGSALAAENPCADDESVPMMVEYTQECFPCEQTVDAIPTGMMEVQNAPFDMDLFNSLGDLPFEREDTKKSSRGKKDTGNERRRSVRLAKKAHQESSPKDSRTLETKVPTKKKRSRAIKSRGEDQCALEILDAVKDSVTKDAVAEDTFTAIKDASAQFLSRVDMHKPVGEYIAKSTVQPNRRQAKACGRRKQDTPLTSRKRASRITDKENDDPETAATNSDEGQSVTSSKDDEGSDSNSEFASDAVRHPSANDGTFKVTKKVEQLYLNKGLDVTKHKMANLETIFESPKKKQTGTPLRAIGGKKIKRFSAFTETPWLGRAGRGRSKKVKRGKVFKKVLSSRKERCWRLDTMLSTLDDMSP
ncbi:uncharacterized protein [Diadema antillarum]|uniref:uncharacterized protein n=1 Tax=Diadema antillarum TaxID=105358 RepID=UPI003A8C2543